MNIADWLMIFAVVTGPLIAVRLSRYLDNRREVRDRKLEIFKTLMATRSTLLSPHHVESLNRIDLEFNAKHRKEKEVIEAWKAYLDLLNDTSVAADQWAVRRVDLLVELLHKMARVLDYAFDKTHIKNSSYHPRGYGELEADQTAIRLGVKALLEGQLEVPIRITNMPGSNSPDNS